MADPHDVVARLVVAVFGRPAEPLDHLQAGAVQFVRARPHLGLQHVLPGVEQALGQVHVEQVAHPRQQLQPVEGLADEVARAAVQGAQ